MRPLTLTLKKIVTASNQNEARSLFLNREKYAISGVIFTPDFEVPELTEEEKLKLVISMHSFIPTKGQKLSELKDEWQNCGALPLNLLSLSLQFNTTPRNRMIRFLHDNKVQEKAHFDLDAKFGWVHVHCSEQGGMQCANPIADEPVEIKMVGPNNDLIDQDDFERLVVVERKIELLTLQSGQAVAFGPDMVHLSGEGARFRGLAFG